MEHLPLPAPSGLPRGGREAPRAEEHALDAPDVHLDALDLVFGLAARGGDTVEVGAPAGGEGLGRVGQGVQVGAQGVEHVLGLGEVLGVADEVGGEGAAGEGEARQVVGLVLGLLARGGGLIVVVVGGGEVGGEERGRGRAGRGLHADVAVEELGGVVVDAIAFVAVLVIIRRRSRGWRLLVVIVVVVVASAVRGVVVRSRDLGYGALKGADEARQVRVGSLVQVDAGGGQSGDHGGDDVLGGAVYEGGGAADEGKGVEETRGGDERRGLGGLCEELGVGHYGWMAGL